MAWNVILYRRLWSVEMTRREMTEQSPTQYCWSMSVGSETWAGTQHGREEPCAIVNLSIDWEPAQSIKCLHLHYIVQGLKFIACKFLYKCLQF